MNTKLILIVITSTILFILSLCVGVMDLSFSNVSDPEQLNVLFISRFPRTFAVILTGISMSVAGLVMQIIVHNRFVEPSTAGTVQGAAIGLLITVFFFPSFSVLGKMGIAALCAMLSMILFLSIAKRLSPADPILLPLVGLIYGSVLQAIVVFVAYEYDLLQLIEVWFGGDFSAVLKGRYELLWFGAAAAIALYLLAGQLTIIGMGEHISYSLGINYSQLVLIALTLVALITALVVISVGMIPFIGLVVPNIVRRFTGDNLRRSLPWTAWTGAVLLLACDVISRTINFPYEIPVSVIFGVLGAVLFLYVLIKPIRSEAQ